MATACWLSADLVKVISVVSALTIPREWMALITMRYSKNYQEICSVGMYLHFLNKVYFNKYKYNFISKSACKYIAFGY